MPIDRNSDKYRIQRLENQIMILRKNLLQTVEILDELIDELEEGRVYWGDYSTALIQCKKEIEQITPYKRH